MKLPLQITFRHMESSPAVVDYIESHVLKLSQHFDCIVSCRVVIDAPPQIPNRGRHFGVAIDLTVPHEKIVVNHEPASRRILANEAAVSPHKSTEVGGAYKDAYVAMHDAFEVAHRRLEDYVQRRRASQLGATA